MATRILHLDHPVGDWPRAVAATPAEIMRLARTPEHWSRAAPADLVLFRGRSWTELLSRPQSDRDRGARRQGDRRGLPDYAELDDLME